MGFSGMGGNMLARTLLLLSMRNAGPALAMTLTLLLFDYVVKYVVEYYPTNTGNKYNANNVVGIVTDNLKQ
jgi:hypothetical protein